MCEQLCLHFYKEMDWGVIWFVHKNPRQTWWSRYLMVFFGRKSCKKMLGEIRRFDRRWRLFGTGLRSGCRCRYLSQLLQYYHNITTFMVLKLILMNESVFECQYLMSILCLDRSSGFSLCLSLSQHYCNGFSQHFIYTLSYELRVHWYPCVHKQLKTTTTCGLHCHTNKQREEDYLVYVGHGSASFVTRLQLKVLYIAVVSWSRFFNDDI